MQDPIAHMLKLNLMLLALAVGLCLCTAIPFESETSFLSTSVQKLPTHSRCQKMCPQCKENPPAPCKCDEACWPGQGVDNTIDETCNCFAQLGFCADGQEPIYQPGEKCPSCWPKNNTACACFAAVGFCEPPAKLPTTSRCSTLCPSCKENPPAPCKCDACWPGASLNATTDHTCECFAELGFCKKGEEPVYTPGKKCPSCWDPANNACACFAAIGFCDAKPTPPAPPAAKDIVELAAGVADLSTLVTALKAANLTAALASKGPFTVFAPTNEAFAKVPKKALDYLLEPEHVAELQAVLKYHVIAGAAIHAKDLKTFQEVKSLEGAELRIVDVHGRVFVDYARVTTPDVSATNGVVHIINEVLFFHHH